MSRVKANWRRVAVWFDGFKKAGEGWKYLQSWENPGATIGTMAGLTSICCYPHVTISLALTGLVLFMVLAYPKQDVGKPRPMEPDPDAEDDEDDEVILPITSPHHSTSSQLRGVISAPDGLMTVVERECCGRLGTEYVHSRGADACMLLPQDNELQGTMVTRLQRRVDGMQKIALKVQNVLDDVASALERCNGLICWADPNASAFFLLIATSWALLIAVLGLHTVLSALLCWMVSPHLLSSCASSIDAPCSRLGIFTAPHSTCPWPQLRCCVISIPHHAPLQVSYFAHFVMMMKLAWWWPVMLPCRAHCPSSCSPFWMHLYAQHNTSLGCCAAAASFPARGQAAAACQLHRPPADQGRPDHLTAALTTNAEVPSSMSRRHCQHSQGWQILSSP